MGKEKTAIEKQAEELEKAVKADSKVTENKAMELLKGALQTITGKKNTDLNKGEGASGTSAGEEAPPASSEQAPPATSEASADAAQGAAGQGAAGQGADASEAGSDAGESGESNDLQRSDIDDQPSMEDVASGAIMADEFLAKSLELQRKTSEAVLKLAKDVEDLKADRIAVNKSLEALMTASLDLVKSKKVTESAPLDPKMIGRERAFAKSEGTSEDSGELRKLNASDKDALYKAMYVEKSITMDEYREAKTSGILPEKLLKK